MIEFNRSIWFWQRTHSPHIGVLAFELANLGFSVTYVTNKLISSNRVNQGWETPEVGNVKLHLAENKESIINLALDAPKRSVHICQGLRGNGLVKDAQSVLRKRGIKHWVIMETIDDAGLVGYLKRLVYENILSIWSNHLEGVLAIGKNAPSWLIARGMYKSGIYPFAYFLKEPQTNFLLNLNESKVKNRNYRFIFVGRLIKLKKVDLLIKAISALKLKDFEFWIIGNGPEEKYLRSLVSLLLPSKVRWLGTLPMSKVPSIIYRSDCLVLPSRYDGWGAVVSESLMVGTPVICSDACGSSVAVDASGVGGIFPSNNLNALKNILRKQYKEGLISHKARQKLANWAKCLGAKSGARYLDLIINKTNKNLIKAPWEKNNQI